MAAEEIAADLKNKSDDLQKKTEDLQKKIDDLEAAADLGEKSRGSAVAAALKANIFA